MQSASTPTKHGSSFKGHEGNHAFDSCNWVQLPQSMIPLSKVMKGIMLLIHAIGFNFHKAWFLFQGSWRESCFWFMQSGSSSTKHDSSFKGHEENHAFDSHNRRTSESSRLLNPSILLISFLNISTFANHDSILKAWDENHAFDFYNRCLSILLIFILNISTFAKHDSIWESWFWFSQSVHVGITNHLIICVMCFTLYMS